MGIPERNASADQVIRCICSIGKSFFGTGFHNILPENHGSHHSRKQSQTALYRVNGIKGQFLVLLHVLVVSKGQTFHRGEKPHKRPINSTGFAANQLCNIRILLLRHNAAASAIAVVQLHKLVFIGIPNNDFFRKPT